ncbi:MAG: hypothetical protein IH586_19755, partial [Anaerolineaceae bacterium]|nr:hypothetical protein [Anaerolineaceae bacterium]
QQARLEEASGDRQRAAALLGEALGSAASAGYRYMFIREGAALRPLLQAARAAAPAFIDGLLAAIPGGNPAATPPVDQARLPEPLSKQELTILRLIAQGKSNQEIAVQLYVSVGTAKWHVHNILSKLGANSRTQAIVTAREIGIL